MRQLIKYYVEIKTRKGGKKIGKIFGPKDGGVVMIAKEEGSTLTEVSKKLRRSGLIPTNVTISKSGCTYFTPTTLK